MQQIDTVLYIRVSSESQNTDRQEQALKDWALKTGSENTYTIIEKVSGSVPAQDRRLNEVFEMPGVKRLVVKDVDRLGRDTIDILQTIKKLKRHNINVTITNLGLDTLLPNGKENESMKLVLSVMATLAEMERQKIRERQKEGIAIAKKKGKYTGRKKGTTEDTETFLAKYKHVQRKVRKGLSLREIASACDVSVNTVRKVKGALENA